MKNLYDKLEEYTQQDYYPYHMPGHKRQAWGKLPKQWVATDITEIDGFDNLHQPEGILKEMQEKAARLYGAEESFCMVNGSTGGILAAVSTVLPEGGRLLIARNCHKSVYHAAYLRNLTISYLYPSLLGEYDICEAVTPGQVQEALKQNPDTGAVLVVSPTYEGRIADIAGIAEVVHQKGIPLIVDEAHGAHLGFHEGWAQNSCRLRADLVIHSVHKTLPAMTQTSLLHVNGNLVNRDRLKRFLRIYQSSSPSYVLLSSIENALNMAEQQGQQDFAAFQEHWDRMMAALSACRNIQVLTGEGKKQDMGKLVISGAKKGLSGQQLYDILLRKYHLQLEMAAGKYCLAMFTMADGEEAYQRMTRALLEIDREAEHGGNTLSAVTPGRIQNAQAVFPLYQAWDMPWEECLLEQSAGKCSAEFVNLYPPGTPILVPGEQITEEISRTLAAYVGMKLTVQGVRSHGQGNYVRVIRE